MENLTFYHGFVIPFIVGTAVLFSVILYKYLRWFVRMPAADKRKVRTNLFSVATLKGVWEVFTECLLHRRIWKVNPVLGYMHTSLALGWFLLIVVGWVESIAYLGWGFIPLQGHIFFKYFTTSLDHAPVWGIDFEALMDLLLLFVLSGVALAWFKRVYSRMTGMKKTTKHTLGDRIALGALWFVFPMRLMAESFTSGIHGSGGFLTGSLGGALAAAIPPSAMPEFELTAWWMYSAALGVFFVSMPFSRYMHIFTEVPLIFMRRWGIRSEEREKSFDHFQIEACSRCGICIDPCQLQSAAGFNSVQSVYFIRDRRYNMLSKKVADNCLMCGRCEERCPVGIELNALRLNSRHKFHNTPADGRYDYVKGLDLSQGDGRTGYFAGCMTLLSPRILKAMESIFSAAGEQVWWADRNGGVCCGRPLKLSGDIDAARDMMSYNLNLFRKHRITTLVTSCPICLKVFREDYRLDGVEVLHHSEYIKRLIDTRRISLRPDEERITYHDPCELGRGCGIYDEPREILQAVGELLEPSETREMSLCCGSSIANTAMNNLGQMHIARSVGERFQATGAETVATSCPLCKKAIARGTVLKVQDLAEIVERHLV